MKLTLPNEDFGRMNKRWNADVRWTFQVREYSILANNHWKVHRTSAFHLLFILPKSSFGSIYINLPLPNEDFGMPNKHFRTRFRSTFQGCESPCGKQHLRDLPHAWLGKHTHEDNMPNGTHDASFSPGPIRRGGKSRKCCFPHGWVLDLGTKRYKVLRKRVLKCLFGQFGDVC